MNTRFSIKKRTQKNISKHFKTINTQGLVSIVHIYMNQVLGTDSVMNKTFTLSAGRQVDICNLEFIFYEILVFANNNQLFRKKERFVKYKYSQIITNYKGKKER